MQRWEYLTIVVQSQTWTDSLGRSGSLPYDGQTGELLNDLGQQGWDLVSVHGDGDDARWYCNFWLFLKRPRE